jgi:RNA ligase
MSAIAIEGLWGQIPEIDEKPERKRSHQALVVRIPEIEKHPNADTLGIVRIEGYQLVVKLGELTPGALAVYIQPDSVVPPEEEFAFMWAGRGYLDGDDVPLKYRRVIPRKFRGEWSEGLLLSIPMWIRYDDHGSWREVQEGDDIADALGVTHYEPPEPVEQYIQRKQRNGWPRSLRGWWYWFLELIGLRPNGVTGGHNRRGPKYDRKVYDVENYKNYSRAFQDGELCIATEKIHGSNARYLFEDGEFFIGSRTMWKNPAASCAWTDAAKQNPDIEAWCRANPGYTLYGEVVPTQGDKFRYGCAPGQFKFFLFDILDSEGKWLLPGAIETIRRSTQIEGDGA